MGFLNVLLSGWYLAHAWFFLVFHCYVGISRTLGFFWCSIVMLVSRARLVFLGVPSVMLVSRARLVFRGVPLLRWYLVHAGFFLVFHCYVGISHTLGFFWCSIVMLVSHARLVFLGVPLSRWYHAWFFLVFHCYFGISRTFGFS